MAEQELFQCLVWGHVICHLDIQILAPRKQEHAHTYILDSGRRVTYKVKQEVPADGIVLDQMGCDVCRIVGGKGHQEIRSCYCQGATWREREREWWDCSEKLFILVWQICWLHMNPLAHLTLQLLLHFWTLKAVSYSKLLETAGSLVLDLGSSTS